MKCKIIQVSSYYDANGYESNAVLYPMTLDWDEVTEEEYNEIRQAVGISNQMSNEQYILISYDESYKNKIFQNVKDWHQAQKEYTEKEAKRKETERLKRESTALDRKRKQLEKLKSELGE